MRFEITTPVLHASLRDCWVIRDDLRLSAERPNWTDRPTWHAIVIESIQVKEAHRRQGHCRRFIEWVAADQRYEIAIGEAVQDKHLEDALKRWGWDCNPQVMDFYYWPGGCPRCLGHGEVCCCGKPLDGGHDHNTCGPPIPCLHCERTQPKPRSRR